MLEFGGLVLTLIALAACANTAPSVANAFSNAMRIAGSTSRSGGTQSVNAVSRALGQPLDAMVDAQERQVPV
jgi:hypothetical protein